MIKAVLTVCMSLLFGQSVFALPDDINFVLDKSQKSLDTQQSKSTANHEALHLVRGDERK